MQHSKFKKVIVWGYPLYSHTHSFVHYGWYKAFKSLGYETHWFNDNDYPKDFDYSESLFIGEGYADQNIPLLASSTYAIHMAHNPGKYVASGCRLIDVRFNVFKTRDYTYNYSMVDASLAKIDDVTFYEEKASDRALSERLQKGVSGYEALYMIWATDMLPDEFNFEDVRIPRKRVVNHVGSVWSANQKEFAEFRDSLVRYNVQLVAHDPWLRVTTNEVAKTLVQESFIAPDIRGSGATSGETTSEESNHLTNGYIPCRIFKNISYGQLGITNSPAVNNLMPEYVVFSSDVYRLIGCSIPYRENFKRMQDAMKYVQRHHTYVNRINSLLAVL